MRRRIKGYTLLEMLLVLIILTILINLAITNVRECVKTAKIETNITSCKTIEKQLNRDRINNKDNLIYDYNTQIKPKIFIKDAKFGEFIYNENDELSFYMYIDNICYVKKTTQVNPRHYEIEEIFCNETLLEE